MEWSEYFINDSLWIKKVDKKFRTNNSLENFISFFKNKIWIKSEIKLVKSVDTLIDITKGQIKYFKKKLKSPIKVYRQIG